MKALFKTFAGVECSFDPITCKVELAMPPTSTTEKWKGDRLFKEMSIPSKREVTEKIHNEQQMLQLNVTEDCSNRCSYCVYSGGYYFERTHTDKLMQFDTAKNAVHHFLSQSTDITGTPHIAFYGGEPLMDGAFELVKAVVAYVKGIGNEKPVTFGVTTNGRHLTRDRIEVLASNGFQLMVSLDGPQHIHDRYRRSRHGEPTFQEIVANLKKLRDFDSDYYQSNVGFICVVTPPLDYKPVRDFFNSDPTVRGHSLIVSVVSLFDQKLPFDIDEKQFGADISTMYRECIARFYENAVSGCPETLSFEGSILLKNLGLLHRAQKEGSDNKEIGPNGCCIPGTRRCFIDTDGTIYACEKSAGFYPIGDVYTYVDIDRSYSFLQEYCELSQSECLECWCGSICDLCYPAARKGTLLDMQRKSIACQERRDFFKALLRLYASMKEKGGDKLLDKMIPGFLE